MNTPEDQIDALLREQNPYVDDKGFTARVVKSLPRRRRARLRPVILLGATVIGSVLAVCWLPWENLPPLDLSVLSSPNSEILLPWILVISVASSLVWSVIATFRWED
jgi:hypothetical protein